MNDRLGSVEQTLSGRWRVRMSLAGVGRKTIDTFDTQEEADAHCIVMADILKREQPFTGKTVLDFGHDVLTQREVGGHISDPGSDWSRWNNHIKTDEIATRAIKSVRDIHVEDWLDRLNAKGLPSCQSIATLASRVTSFFDSRASPSCSRRVPRSFGRFTSSRRE